MIIYALPLACILGSPDGVGQADAAWPQFLGPRGTAVVESTPATLDFARPDDVLWRTTLPPGSSSPCIAADRIFLTAAEGSDRIMLAIDRRTGRELWRRIVQAPPPGPTGHVDVDPAAPTPCTDGGQVIFYFGDYGLIAYDVEGAVRWEKRLPDPKAFFGIGTSPILLDDLVVLVRDGCPDSAIHALSKDDGTERWSVPRLGFIHCHGTPFVWENAERRELIVAGTQRLAGFDPSDGRELWHLTGLTTLVCTTPTADRDTLYFAGWSTPDADQMERAAVSFGALELTDEQRADVDEMFARLDGNGDGRIEAAELPESRAKAAFNFVDRDDNGSWSVAELAAAVNRPEGSGRNLMVAVRAGGAGDVSATHVRWTHRRGLPYVSSPLLHEGRLYLVKAGGLITCLDPATGRPHFDRVRLDDRSEYYASPVGVDGHVILCSSAGSIFVLAASDEFELVRSVDLGERLIATPAVVDGTIYVRSMDALWAFGR